MIPNFRTLEPIGPFTSAMLPYITAVRPCDVLTDIRFSLVFVQHTGRLLE